MPAWFKRLLRLEEAIEQGQYHRWGGDVICEVCEKKYYDHPHYAEGLTLLCDGYLAHL